MFDISPSLNIAFFAFKKIWKIIDSYLLSHTVDVEGIIMNKIILIGIIIGGVALICYSQKTESVTPSYPVGKYQFYTSHTAGIDNDYVLDTQTGRLWRRVIDPKRKILIFYPEIYESSVENNLSLIPNEHSTDITMEGSSTPK